MGEKLLKDMLVYLPTIRHETSRKEASPRPCELPAARYFSRKYSRKEARRPRPRPRPAGGARSTFRAGRADPRRGSRRVRLCGRHSWHIRESGWSRRLNLWDKRPKHLWSRVPSGRVEATRMTTELDVNKHIDVVVYSDGVVFRDDQNGDVVLGGEVFERVYQQYLAEQDNASFVTEADE